MALTVEKIIQHVTVSLALAFNWMDIRASVAVDPRLLVVLGSGLAILFALALWALVTDRRWAHDLLIALALADIIGEFVVQRTLAIAITVSFAVAVLLLFLTFSDRRRGPA